jgi:tetratricopeptide (TPR) repeat protein
MKPQPARPTGVQTGALVLAAHGHWTAGRYAQATAAYQEIARLEPRSAEAHTNLGAALAAGGHLTAAVASLERALALRPSFEMALQNLGHALEQLGREKAAAAVFRRLARVTKSPVERRLLLATALSLEGASAEAEVEARRAVAAAPGHPRAHALMGKLLLERGAFEDAERSLLRAIDDVPDAFQQLAVTRPMSEADRPLLERMSARVARGDLNPVQRSAVHFGLGKAYDDLGDYARAIENFDLGNALRHASARLDREGLAARYDRLISRYSAAALDAPGPREDLPALIVGMPRSGTTLVEQILSSHPDVAAGGELSFWSDQLASGAASPAQAAGDYLHLLRRIGPGALRVTDKAPTNFEGLGLIRTSLPGARIVHCRRQPIDTCLSILFTNYQGRQAWSRGDIVFQYRQYQRLMAHWRSVLSPDRFIEVDYEAMVADREGQTRRLIAFSGLDWSEACLAPEENRRVVRSASVWQARQGAYTRSVDRWRNYEPWLGELRELLTTPT